MSMINEKKIITRAKRLYIFTFLCILVVLLMPKVNCRAETTVSSGDNEKIEVTELDLGDCPKEMIVGTSQMLSVLTIPANATENEFTYKSSNEEVATVNALGRLTANKVGKAKITVKCGKVKNSFEVSVVSGSTTVLVEDIEIGDYEEELEVDKTLYLSAKVLPMNATNTLISYHSSDEQIAKVNSSGEVKGIAPGQVTIEVSAGNITKEVNLTVKIGTTAIKLNSDYVVLKPEDTFQISAKVYPEGANQTLTYKSLDSDIATVSDSGVITAKSSGATAITVSNDDFQVSISVIVNEQGKAEETIITKNISSDNSEKLFPEEVSVKKYPVITSDMLKYFYEKEKTLTIKDDTYTIFVDGRNIVNFENELDTRLEFTQEENGFSFIVNKNEKLCGEVTIDISNKVTNEKYLYLYNEAKEKYERLEVKDVTLLMVDTNGKYLLVSEKLSKIDVNIGVVLVGVVVCAIVCGIYIVCKKRYWFW